MTVLHPQGKRGLYLKRTMEVLTCGEGLQTPHFFGRRTPQTQIYQNKNGPWEPPLPPGVPLPGTVPRVEASPARAGQPVTPLTQERLSISNFCDSELEFIIQGSTLKITARKALQHLSQMITVGCNLD